MASPREMEPVGHYQQMVEEPSNAGDKKVKLSPESENPGAFSNNGHAKQHKKPIRSSKKRADIQASIKEREDCLEPAGCVWAGCLGAEVLFADLLKALKRPEITNPCYLKVENTYSEVLFCRCFAKQKTVFIFRFGCVVAWDVNMEEQKALIAFMHPFLKEPLGDRKEDDTMTYVWGDRATIKADSIHLVTTNVFECLAYSYAFAQSVKLALFETLVDADIERTKMIPESLARTGNIQSTREDIGRRIGELFVNRFYINLHTDILDTPVCLVVAVHCSRLLVQVLDIIKDLYDMLNNELTIQASNPWFVCGCFAMQHGYKLEWIVIYLICIEVRQIAENKKVFMAGSENMALTGRGELGQDSRNVRV
ncbi:putative family cog1723 domain-containing protein [Cyclospora cayetanensis]|uniref:Family cog1723 domain-containing protein n=1 Tax=Cyclospora cayetanensis TaxID=88456 RepID=A0A1D3CVN5_9EIME|nr:putative family cog1723 domain-containing protein [Cyclospora cayetanensis]